MEKPMRYLFNQLLKLEVLCLVLVATLPSSAMAAASISSNKQSPPTDIILDPEVEPQNVIPETWQRRQEERHQDEQQWREERYQMEAQERQQELWDRQQENWSDYQQEQRNRTQQRLDEWEQQRREQLRGY
jgi:hypothetical protein